MLLTLGQHKIGQKGSRIICIELYIQCDDQFGSSVTCVGTFKIKESD
jgi:hypothetical protein